MRTAGFFRRFFGDIVDFIIIIFSFAFVFWLFNLEARVNVREITVANILLHIGLTSLPLLYYSLFESSKMQATPGEWLMGLRVYSKAYQRLSFWHAVGRYLSGVLSQFILTVLWIVGAILSVVMGVPASVVFWAIVCGFVVSVIWWFCTYYIRIFSHRQQTFRDFLSRSLVIVVTK